MLSVFPDILFLAPFSYFLIRIALALVLIFAVRRHWSRTEMTFRGLAMIEVITAISIGAGAWTQLGALVGVLIALFWLVRPWARPVSFIATLLTLVLCLSLIITGAGPLAFDLPL
ncbi:MAG: hypothetical protein Q7S08_01090 [bacterium]|nr:hypothetical protein [bacterium]